MGIADRDGDLKELCEKPLICTCGCGVLARMVIATRDRAESAEADWQLERSAHEVERLDREEAYQQRMEEEAERDLKRGVGF